MDTLKISEFKYQHRKGEFQIREKMVKIISYSNAFEPIYTQIDTDIANSKINDYNNKSLNLMIDQVNKVILLEDTIRKIKFEGIQID
jgi:ABC-type polysaccharide/polyol phosphate transport system ATPase subunit